MGTEAPESLNKYVVHPASLAVHTDENASTLEHIEPCLTGELRALVGVEDLRRPKARKRLLEGRHAKVRCQRVGKPEGKYLATGDVEYGDQEQKSVCHRDIANIRGPHLVRSLDLQTRQQVRVNYGSP